MARWDKFLNEASRGYGVGFQRYQQYADARDKRLNRADMAEVAAGMQQLENAQAVPTQMPHRTRFEDAPVKAMPLGTGEGADTAVNTAPPPPMMLDRDPTRRDQYDPTMGYGDTLLTPPTDAPPARDPVRGGMALAGVTPEQQQGILDRGRKAEIAAGLGEFAGGPPMRPESDKPKAVEESTKKGEGKTAAASAKEALSEATMMAGPNKGKVPIRIDVTQYDTDTPTAEVWNNVRTKLMDVAIRNGDYESVIALPEKIAGMQQQGFLRYMEQAMQVQNDPEALAALMTKAYSYYPDGSAMQFQVDDGQLYGYGFDEATGKFQGGTAINGDTIAMAMQQAQDPVQFYKDKRAAELAAQERREDMGWKQRDYDLKAWEAESTHAVNMAKRFHSIAQGNAVYAKLLNHDPAGVSSWKNGYEDVAENKKLAVNSLNDGYQNKTWPDPIMEVLVSDEGVGYRKMVKLVDSLAGNVTPDQNLGMQVVPSYAAALAELEMVNSQVESGDADQDEFLEAIARNKIEEAFLTDDGNINVTIDGVPMEFNSGILPGVADRIISGGMKPSTPSNAVDPSAPVEGQPLNTKQALGVIGDTTMDALGTGADALGKVVANSPPVRATKAAIELGKEGIQTLGETLREPPGKSPGSGSKSEAAAAVKPQKLESVIDALIMAESGGDPMAVSPVGAQGLAQVMPATARDPGFGVTPLKDPFDPVQSRRFAKEYLGAMLKRYDDDLEAALVAYNAGPGNADKFVRAGNDFSALPKRSETEPYVRKITGALYGG